MHTRTSLTCLRPLNQGSHHLELQGVKLGEGKLVRLLPSQEIEPAVVHAVELVAQCVNVRDEPLVHKRDQLGRRHIAAGSEVEAEANLVQLGHIGDSRLQLLR